MSFAHILKQIPDGWLLQRIENLDTLASTSVFDDDGPRH